MSRRAAALLLPLALACSGTYPITMPQLNSSSELTVVGIIDHDYLDRQIRANANRSAAIPDGPLAPTSFAVSGAGTVVIADQSSGRLWEVVQPGTDAARPGQVAVGTSTLREPGFVRADRVGNIYVSGIETGRITVCDPRLRPVGVIEPPYEALGLVGGRPTGIAFGPQGEFYVADQTNAVVYRFDAAGAFVAAFGGDDAVGDRLLRPAGLACSPDGGAIYVCDPGTRRVLVFEPSGVPIRTFGGTDLLEPRNIAVDASGQCFVADEEAKAVVVFSADGRFVRSITGLPSSIAGWTRPTDVAVNDSLLWIADPAAGRIVVVAVARPAR